MSRDYSYLFFAGIVALATPIIYYRSKAASEEKDYKWTPKITIDTTPVEDDSSYSYLLNEVRLGSITPTTFDIREYETSSSPIFTETYTYYDNSVIRFGINTIAIKLDSTLLKTTGSSTSRESSVSSKHSTKKFVTKQVDQIFHTKIEIDTLSEALKDLFSDDTKTTVLLDIIARDGVTLKIAPKTGLHEVHCIVLYKNPLDKEGKNEVIVIDPSNSSYSWHIENKDAYEHLPDDIKGRISSIKTHHKARQIYKAEAKESGVIKTGPNFTDFRDCIDISVKIAFSLNNLPVADRYIDIEKIEKHPALIALSNNRTIDDNFDTDKGIAVRLKQTSSVETIKKFMALEIETRKLLKIIGLFPSTYDAEILESEYKDLLAKPDTCKISDLSSFHLSLS